MELWWCRFPLNHKIYKVIHLNKDFSAAVEFKGKRTVITDLMFIGLCFIVMVEEWKTNLMSLAILFQFLCTQHVSDINISIIRSLRLCWWITTSVVLFSVRCVLEIWSGWVWVVSVLQASAKTTDVVIHQHSRKLLIMNILMSEICPLHKKWNKIASDIKLVFYSSVITKFYTSIVPSAGQINLNSP